MSNNEDVKKCPFCAEEVKSEAVKCKHCGERLDQKVSTPTFEKFEEWLKQSYPAYKVVSKNTEENFVVLNKEHKSFNGFVFVLLLLLYVLPGIIYALVTLSGKKIITLTVYFDEVGAVNRVSNSGFGFLGRKYNESRGIKSV